MKSIQTSSFDETDFIGPEWYVMFMRWFRQFIALFRKNVLILLGKPYQLCFLLILPSLAVLVLRLGDNNPSSESSLTSGNLLPTTLLNDLGSCDTYAADQNENCLFIAFSPSIYPFTDIMSSVASNNNLEYETNIRGFINSAALKNYISNNLGKVQFSVFFVNESLWIYNNITTKTDNPTNSYVIFYNETQGSSDSRSNMYGVNFPLLVLQQSIERAMLEYFYEKAGKSVSNFTYDLNFGQSWSFIPPSTTQTYSSSVASNATCEAGVEKDFADVASAAPYVFGFGFQLAGLFMFQILNDERHKGLIQMLRRLGLMESTYWISWMMTSQVFILLSVFLALIVSAIIRPTTFILQHLDFGVLFLFLWLSFTHAVSNAFFLSSICKSSASASILTFINFLGAFLTILIVSSTLDTYQYYPVLVNGKFQSQCVLGSSTYNEIYDNRVAIEMVQFIVFCMPWFLTGSAINNILSVIQNKNSNDFTVQTMYQTFLLTDVTGNTGNFHNQSLSYTYGLMVAGTLVYVTLSWFFSQLIDGIPVDSILVPRTLRLYLMGYNNPVLEHDVRGQEKLISQQNQCIRAYKVSKTFTSVQALKEVSFGINKGQVFCLLGHNGAGKSTLFNLLSGILAPTHGKVFISGYDVEYDMLQIQQIIGVCPQDDFLWDELTAMDHMEIHAQFKGLRLSDKLTAACENVLSLVGLLERKDTLAKNFSGGMKRRLSAAMSIVGNVKVLYLDEPTTGLDPISRRAIWDMISIVKKDRVVVLTTHNLEEADYLGDQILILHSGQVKALGDPLYLKQTYGEGYQLRIVVDSRIASPVSKDVLKFLPRSNLSGDVSTGSIVVKVSKNDMINLARFLEWLETIQTKSTAIKEWVISNTTLEQVFLHLSASSEVNYMEQENRQRDIQNLCPMCQKNPRSNVTLIPYSEHQMLIIPDSICESCSVLSCFLISKDEYSPLLEDMNEELRNQMKMKLLRSAMDKAASLHAAPLSNSYDLIESFNEVMQGHPEANETEIELLRLEESKQHDVMSPLDQIESGRQISQQSPSPGNPSKVSSMNSLNRVGTFQQQVNALMMKNVTLQLYQRYSTGCSVVFVCLMFLAVYIIGLIWPALKICNQGYTTSTNCDVSTLETQLFFADFTDSSGVSPVQAITTALGYSFLVYLIPNNSSSLSQSYQVKADPQAVLSYAGTKYYPVNAGLSNYIYRKGVIWATSFNATEKDFNEGTSLFYPYSPSESAADLNALMYARQSSVFEDTQSGLYSNCSLFASEVYSNVSSIEALTLLANNYADAIFECFNSSDGSTCSYGALAGSSFNGTIWIAKVGDTASYPYSFADFPVSSTQSDSSEVCPVDTYCMTSYGYIGDLNNPSNSRYVAPTSIQNSTIVAMQYINMLTNALLDPNQPNYAIQGGVSYYGLLSFNTGSDTFEVFLLTMITVLMLNGWLPLAIWRLSYENSNDIRTMLTTVGLKPNSYVAGMYLFDMITMMSLGWIGFIIFVYSDLSRYKDAPLGYLLAISFTSSHALCGASLLIVKIGPKNSRITALVSTLVSMCSSVAACLISIILYNEPGTWPNGLSVIPFFAQVRALIRILTDHKTSDEVDTAIGLLFLFGTVCIGMELIIDYRIQILQSMRSIWWKHFLLKDYSMVPIQPVHSSEDQVKAIELEEELLQNFAENHEMLTVEVDEDVQEERLLARDYHRLEATMDPSYAVVITELHQEFQIDAGRPLVALKELSICLKFGEVFGLLGPNGAGKSTTISIISGLIKPTSGDVYVAGINIQSNMSDVYKLVGICPQHDTVWEDLTVEEHLFFQARQRGVPGSQVYSEVQRVAVLVGLDGDSFKSKAGKLSGGQRRRLSIGMSIVSDPPIIIMDEPSSGLDPTTRQGLWQLIQRLKRSDRLILLTTHSMEEAEALCTRLAIISQGVLKCIGDSVHLKSKYGTGYVLEVNKLVPSSEREHRQLMMGDQLEANSDLDRLDEFIEESVALNKGSRLIACVNNTRKYHIPKGNVKISNIFSTMERNKARFNIREWAMSETTLEDIFISLV